MTSNLESLKLISEHLKLKINFIESFNLLHILQNNDVYFKYVQTH